MVTEILQELNTLDEHPSLEAKSCSSGKLGDSFFESVCSFSNEPGLGGGRIVLGIAKDEDDFFGGYKVVGVKDPDKIQLDIASGCSEKFNIPIRPRIALEEYEGKVVLIVEIDERAESDKPIYFTKHGLPKGAWRRIGSSDQRCSDEDMVIFYGGRSGESYDLSIVSSADMADIDPDAIETYRRLRADVNPAAEELSWSDDELLQALSAVKKDNSIWKPTLSGLLLFGTRMSLRRELPMVRVDYIRVSGNEWVSDPDKRFSNTIDMRGPVLQLVDRVLAAIFDDLPKGFELKEGDVQAKSKTLPSRVLREAIVNALMHRSYREHQPTQVIRYNNRIEIRNAGFSLKNEDSLGEAGSQLRNPNLAAVFHETNTAETKGSGIRTMRKLMKENGFSPPTFESSRAENYFISRLLLHHFLSEEDVAWLKDIPHDLNQNQKISLIFVREQGAIDNQTQRQLTGGDVLTASTELRKLRECKLLEQKGKGSATYYVKGDRFPLSIADMFSELLSEAEEGDHTSLDGDHTSSDGKHTSLGHTHTSYGIPSELSERIANHTSRVTDKEDYKSIIVELCSTQARSVEDLCQILARKGADRLKRDYLTPLREEGRLEFAHPDMEKHPQQAYKAIK